MNASGPSFVTRVVTGAKILPRLPPPDSPSVRRSASRRLSPRRPSHHDEKARTPTWRALERHEVDPGTPGQLSLMFRSGQAMRLAAHRPTVTALTVSESTFPVAPASISRPRSVCCARARGRHRANFKASIASGVTGSRLPRSLGVSLARSARRAPRSVSGGSGIAKLSALPALSAAVLRAARNAALAPEAREGPPADVAVRMADQCGGIVRQPRELAG